MRSAEMVRRRLQKSRVIVRWVAPPKFVKFGAPSWATRVATRQRATGSTMWQARFATPRAGEPHLRPFLLGSAVCDTEHPAVLALSLELVGRCTSVAEARRLPHAASAPILLAMATLTTRRADYNVLRLRLRLYLLWLHLLPGGRERAGVGARAHRVHAAGQ